MALASTRPTGTEAPTNAQIPSSVTEDSQWARRGLIPRWTAITVSGWESSYRTRSTEAVSGLPLDF